MNEISGQIPPPRVPDDARVWRAVDVFRGLTLVYATFLFISARDDYRHPIGAWLVLLGMAAWTGYLILRRARTTAVLVVDLVLTLAAVLSTLLVDDPARIAHGAATLPSTWAAAAVVSWAVGRGWRAGLAAGLLVAAADLVEVWPNASSNTVDSIVQLVLVGALVGYTVELYAAGRRDLALAVAVDAAARERERLAADIHDSVLQVLAYVQWRGAEVGGEAAEIGRLAGEQEARLRAMVSSGPPTILPDGEADLRGLLGGLSSRSVLVSGPAGPVLLPHQVAAAVAAAVIAALDNVTRHAGEGAHAWVLLEDEDGLVTVTVRDDGDGMEPGRIEQAATEGRLGISAAIRGRITDVGGEVTVISGPGEGTEIEVKVRR